MRVRYKKLAGQPPMAVLVHPSSTVLRKDGKVMIDGPPPVVFNDNEAREVPDDLVEFILSHPNFAEDPDDLGTYILVNPTIVEDKSDRNDANALEPTPSGGALIPFTDEQYFILPIMASGPVRTTFDSILASKDKWRGVRSAQPPTFGDPNGTYVAVGDPRGNGEQLTPEQREAAADTVLSLDDEHAQTFAFLMAHWMVQNRGRERPQRARVHVNDLLEFRELKRQRKRDFKPEQKRDERDRILRLSKMWVAVRDLVAPRGKKRKTKAVNVFSQLIELAIETDATGVGAPIPLLSDGIPPASIPYAFRYEPGEWVNSYWGDTRYVTSIFSKVLAYNTRVLAERMAMRVALYLSLVPFQSERTVEEIFIGAHLPLPKIHPREHRDAFDDALGRLRNDHIIAGYEYVGGEPLDAGKGWSKTWLAAKVRVFPQTSSLLAAAAPSHLSVFLG